MIKRLVLIFAVVLSFVVVSCSEDKSTEPTGPDTQVIPAADQAEAAEASADQVSSMISQIDGYGDGLTGGGIYKKDGINDKDAPDGWIAVDESWYEYTKGIPEWDDYYDMRIRFTPDIWLTEIPDYDTVTKYEYKFKYYNDDPDENGNVYQQWLWDAYAQYSDGTKTIIDGVNNYDYSSKFLIQDTYTMEYKYIWGCDFDGVSVSENDKSAHFTMDCVYPYSYSFDGSSINMLYSAITGEFKFAANGAGNLDEADLNLAGRLYTNGTLFVKLYCDGTNGWYKIAADSYAAQTLWYPFSK